MNQNTAITNRNDDLVSRIVKVRDPYCRLKLTGCQGQTMDPMHVFGRGNKGTRWLLTAVFGGCRKCHDFIDTHPKEKEKIFCGIMGEEVYNEAKRLSLRVNKYFLSELIEINESLANTLCQIQESY